ncbi:helix-turn-helix transcriptional regulator [Niabella aurantiaca]|uniref:helix-turn-helix transcriptional regulator n=1 Tax=Niabella aurantiaca TaxID=379900 RepID=UPI00037443CE|nr:helix-turn-helix transcriptional regulator [Niabella aurantiaca]
MKEIRKNLNLSQQELALLLNVSRSTIAMYEKGLRPLPPEASLKWMKMQQQWQENQRKPNLLRPGQNSYLTVQQEQCLAFLNAQAQRAAIRSVSVTQQLAALEDQHRILLQKLHFLKELLEETPRGSRQAELIGNRMQHTLIGLAYCGPERRQLLSYKLQVLTAQQKAALASKVIVQQLRYS